MKNDKGIFLVTIHRSILLKLIYNDKSQEIDSNLSDSQVGARKGKNIRNHIWVLNSITNDVLRNKKREPIDIQILDYQQCFDSLWLSECLNDMFRAGFDCDKLPLLEELNKKANIKVKTPVGISEEGEIKNVVMQGDVFGPLFCSVTVDTIGKECLEEKKYLYMYKNKVPVPPLSIIDDLICVSTYGSQTAKLNGFINVKTDCKKLQFGSDKCKKMHIGIKQEEYKCADLHVNGWEVKPVEEINTGKEVLVDKFMGEVKIEEVKEEKYLGDLLTDDGQFVKNIKHRKNKGIGIVRKLSI